ncbi:hypothetical protein FRC17_009740, partial [Serendipita sp. 399]
LEEQRKASRQRVLAVWGGLEKRYSRSLDDDDIVDLESLTLIQDAGTLKRLGDFPFGSLATIEASEDEDYGDEEDELGDWDNTRFSAEAARRQNQIAFPTRRWTEEDERDLQAFMRAERERREEEEWVSDEDAAGGELETVEEYTEDGLTDQDIDSRRYSHQNEADYGEEEDEDSNSSFRPSEDQRMNTASGSESEDELGLRSQSFKTPPTIEGTSQGYPDSPEESSEDELAMASPVRKAQAPEQYQYAVKGRPLANLAATLPPSGSDRRRMRTSDNPQLSTPPRSRSSGISVPSEPYLPRASKLTTSPVARLGHSSLTPSGTDKALATRHSSTVLGKRKRYSPPFPTPTRSIPPSDRASSAERYYEDQSYRSVSPPLRDNSMFEGGYSDDDGSPDPLEDGLSTYGSASTMGHDSRRHHTPVSVAPSNRQRHQSSRSNHGRRPPTVTETDEESTSTPDINLLLFHMKGVNEWLKAHHPGAFSAEESAISSTWEPPTTPSKPSLPRIGFGSTTSLVTPRNPHRVMSSFGGESSARSIRSSSSAMGPPPTPLKLFQPSPEKGSTDATDYYASPSRVSHSRYHAPRGTPLSRVRRVCLSLFE